MAKALDDLLIHPEATIRDAMVAIDRGAREIALVVDHTGRLMGTVSDGDVRRALLGGAELEDAVLPFASTTPKVVSPDTSRVDVLDRMRAYALSQMPVLENGRLVGLHMLNDLLGRIERDNVAVIMAGGKGTRLGALTKSVPKPMLPVAGRPILERLVHHLVGSGVCRIVLSIGHLGEVIEQHFGDGSDFGCSIDYLRENPDAPLGTGGPLALLAGWDFTSPLLVMNADLVTDASVDSLLRSHEASGTVATVAVDEYTHEVPFGVVSRQHGRLVELQEKPVARWEVTTGLYVLEPSLLCRVPSGSFYPLPNLLMDCLDRGEAVNVWRTEGDWQDIGRPAELRRARGDL